MGAWGGVGNSACDGRSVIKWVFVLAVSIEVCTGSVREVSVGCRKEWSE